MVVGADALRSGDASLFSVLYVWMPLLAGVAVAIRPANRRSVGSSIAVAGIAALLMIALDISTSFQDVQRPTGAFFLEGQVQEKATVAGVVKESWVRTGSNWMQGSLQGADQQAENYSEGHPRLVVAEALGELGLFLLCFATVGIVLGVCSWLGRHARFDSSANEAGARIAVAWLVSAGVIMLAQGAVTRRRFDVLFGDAALWALLLPCFGFLALGALGFLMAARSDDRESPDRP